MNNLEKLKSVEDLINTGLDYYELKKVRRKIYRMEIQPDDDAWILKETLLVSIKELLEQSPEHQKKILDMCCGSKMFYYDKENSSVLFVDNRLVNTTLCDGRRLVIEPDMLADFTKLPFEASSFKMVVFDPPHLNKVGDSSWLAKKYGRLPNDWKKFLTLGFKEAMRVLETHGVLIFKWNEEQIKASEILKLIPYKPVLGDKRSKTHWMIFLKTKKED